VFLGGRHARGAPPETGAREGTAEPTPATTEPAVAAPASPAAPAETGQPPRPATPAEALDRAAAAYDFGDLHQMIDLARLVAEGALPGNEDQRATALRLLGIGLYLDGRMAGAEKAFVDLLALRPRSSLDPSVTRPEVVGFFRDVRRRHQPKKYLLLDFLPPAGQFQNHTPVRGWIIGGLEVATLGAAVTSRLLLSSWRDGHGVCIKDDATCDRMKMLNIVGVAGLSATWAVGVIDALLNHGTGDADGLQAARERDIALSILPTGAALRVSF
jgi:hypothetical protein